MWSLAVREVVRGKGEVRFLRGWAGRRRRFGVGLLRARDVVWKMWMKSASRKPIRFILDIIERWRLGIGRVGFGPEVPRAWKSGLY